MSGFNNLYFIMEFKICKDNYMEILIDFIEIYMKRASEDVILVKKKIRVIKIFFSTDFIVF